MILDSAGDPETQAVAWRLDSAKHKDEWDSGEGAFRSGGRWNTRDVRAVYCAMDAATAILEVTVHKGFATLDRKPHVITKLTVNSFDSVHSVRAADVPNPYWLVPSHPTPGQQEFGNELLDRYGAFLAPSVVCKHSWNFVFLAGKFDAYTLSSQERFALDPRLAKR